MLKFVNAYLPPVLWACLIFFLSHQSMLPGVTSTWADYIFKKSAHMGVYAILYILVYRATKVAQLSPTTQLIWPLIICFLYAVSDEVHQSFIPGRHPSPFDIGYDMLGVGIAWFKKNRLARFF